MSNKYVGPGNTLGYANTGSAISSGAVVVLQPGPDGLIGIAADDIPATTGFGALEVDGIFRLSALSTDVWSIGEQLYWDAANTRLTSTKSGNTRAGVAACTKASGDTTAEVMLEPAAAGTGLVGSLVAAGTALTNSTTETALGSVVIPANALKVGDVLKIRFQGICTSTNSTDTLAVKLTIGTAAVGATALLSLAATDVSNNDVFTGEYSLVIRTIGATGTMVGVGVYKSIPAAEGTMTSKDDILASTTIDTTSAQYVSVTGTWSVASASNSCRLDILNVERVR